MRLWQRPDVRTLERTREVGPEFPEVEETTDRWSGVYADPTPALPGALARPPLVPRHPCTSVGAMLAFNARKSPTSPITQLGAPGEGRPGCVGGREGRLGCVGVAPRSPDEGADDGVAASNPV